VFAYATEEEIPSQYGHLDNILAEPFDKTAGLLVSAKEEVLVGSGSGERVCLAG
jgi:hypothetical protein